MWALWEQRSVGKYLDMEQTNEEVNPAWVFMYNFLEGIVLNEYLNALGECSFGPLPKDEKSQINSKWKEGH